MTVWSDLFTDVDGTLISAHAPTSGFTYVRNLVRGSDHQNQILNNHLMKGGTAFGFGYPAYDSAEELNSRIARFGVDIYLPTLHDGNVPGLGIALRTDGNLSQRRLVIGVREQSLVQMRILFIGVTALGGSEFFLTHIVNNPVRDRVYRVELDIDEFDMARVYLDGVNLPDLDQNVASFLGNHIGLEGAGFDSEMWLDNLTVTFGAPECFPDTSTPVADPTPLVEQGPSAVVLDSFAGIDLTDLENHLSDEGLPWIFAGPGIRPTRLKLVGNTLRFTADPLGPTGFGNYRLNRVLPTRGRLSLSGNFVFLSGMNSLAFRGFMNAAQTTYVELNLSVGGGWGVNVLNIALFTTTEGNIATDHILVNPAAWTVSIEHTGGGILHVLVDGVIVRTFVTVMAMGTFCGLSQTHSNGAEEPTTQFTQLAFAFVAADITPGSLEVLDDPDIAVGFSCPVDPADMVLDDSCIPEAV